MKRSGWLRKALWITPLVLLLLALGSFFILRSYLASERVTHDVAARLQDMLGGRVEVQSAHIELVGTSNVQGIQAFEDGEPNKPWLRIDDVSTDISALSLALDKSPDVIQLQGARITLRFDRDGHLLTKLPAKKKGPPTKIPRLHIEGGELTLDQEHRSPMMIRGVTADITPQDDRLTLTGTVRDPFWGDWKAQGLVDTADAKGSLTLDTEQVMVTMDKLKAIAFVPLSVWQEVQVEGTTPAQVRLEMDTAGDKPNVSYHVEISPPDAHVHVPSIDLDATHAHGKAIIADEIVTLDDVHGHTAGGEITTDGKLNFHDDPTRLAFKVGVQNVILHNLPRSWKIPTSVDGKLTGSADLVLVINKGKVETSGSGEGVIREARWSGFPINKPVRLALRSEAGRFRFHQPKPGAIADDKPSDKAARADDLISVHHAAPPEESEQGDEGGLLQNAPTQLVNVLGHGIQMAGESVARGIDAAASTLGKLKPPSKPDEQPTYLDVDLSLKDVDVAQLVKKLGLNLPYPITGRLTFQVHASIPVNTAGDLKAYRLRGDAQLPKFNIDGLAMTDVAAQVRYIDGILDLQKLTGQIVEPGPEKTTGHFSGDARVQVVPRGDLQATLKLDRVPLATLLNVVPQVGNRIRGALSGTVQGRVPLEKLDDLARWRGAANLTAPRLDVYGLPLQDATVGLIVDDSKARLTTLKADLEGSPLTGKGEVRFQQDYPFQASVDLERGNLTTLNRLAPAFRPPFELRGQTQLRGLIHGTLKPFKFDTTGNLSASNLVVERFAVDQVSFKWSKEQNDLKLDAIKMRLYGGSITGTARLPLSSAAPGSANLNVRELNVQAMSKALPAFPVRLEGKVSGTVRGKLSGSDGEKPRTWTSDVEVTAPQLRVQGIPAEKLKGTLESHHGRTSYNLRGETLGGTFSLKGDLPQSKQKENNEGPVGEAGPELIPAQALAVARRQPAEEPPGRGHFELRDARLSQVWDAYNITGGLAHLRGRFSIILDYQLTEPSFFPAGNGTFRIVNIGWDDDTLGESLQGDVRLVENAMELNNISGEVAGGLFLGRLVFGLKANSRSWFRIELQQVEASRLLTPLPAVAANVKGPVDVNLRGNINQEWTGGGVVTLVRGQVYGLSITEWRIPLTFSFAPSQGNGELSIRDSSARIAQGRARFESTMNWGNALRLSGQLLFYQVDLRTLLQHSPSVAAYVSGRVSGRVDLAGSEMRSVNDLSAVVQARMEQGQALQLPVLRQLTPYLRPGVSQSRFQSGELKGRLAGGVFRIQRATLIGDFLKLLIQGTINLAGNLDLDVTAQTGLYCLNPTRTNAVSSRIPIIGAIPRLILYEASALLSAAVVQLSVTGTVRSPIIRVEPLVVLTEEAVRFFLNRTIGLGVPNLP